MFSVSRLAQLIAAAITFTSFVVAIDTITISGRHFVNSNTGEKVCLSSLFVLILPSFGSKESM